jgi:Arc/MetJ-type ribon-helix-helix transcriptional regulator
MSSGAGVSSIPICHAGGVTRKIAVTLDAEALRAVDRIVREGRFPNRSKAVQSAVELWLAKEKRVRYSREMSKLDPKEERRLAEEG